MDKKRKKAPQNPPTITRTQVQKKTISLPLLPALLELHVQFYCSNVNTGGLTGKAKEQKQSKVQPVDTHHPSPASQGDS